MKTLKLQLSTEFPYYHHFAEQPTNFKESILSGKKIHSIKKDKYEIEELKFEMDHGNTILNLWTYENNGYGTQIEVFKKIMDAHYTQIVKKDGHWYVGNWKLPVKTERIAANEGLTLQAFNGLWPLADYKHLTLFYFTEFQYEDINDQRTLKQHLKNFNQVKEDSIKLMPEMFGDIVIKRQNHYDR
jgi:hypothetical protein